MIMTGFSKSVSSRDALSIWCCQQHNNVNSKLGKSQFDCSIQRINERWKVGHRDCWPKDNDDEIA